MPRHAERETRLNALRWVALAVSPFATRAALERDWPQDWQAIVAAADQGMVLPALQAALRRHALDETIPADLRDFLDAVFMLHAGRRAGLRAEMIAVNRLLAAGGLRPVWLKGAETLLAEDFACGSRSMNDLDLWLIGSDAQAEGLRLLEAAGWRTRGDELRRRGWDRSHHLPPLEHEDWPARLELHRQPVIRQQAAVLPADATADAVIWSDWEGGGHGRLDPLSGALLAFVQATAMAYAGYVHGRVPLMKSLDFVERIAVDFGGAVPEAMLERLQKPLIARFAAPFLTFASAYHGLPAAVPDDDRYIRAVRRNLLHPRWNAIVGGAADLVGRRGRSILAEPERIPGIFGDWAGRLVGYRGQRD